MAVPADRHDDASIPAAVLLPQAEARLLRSENAERPFGGSQAALLDALAANVALLSADGTIVAVNAAWKRFGAANGWGSIRAGVGDNYLRVCDAFAGEPAESGQGAASGIRSVLCGDSAEFALEYPCPSATAERWFRMTATPLLGEAGMGAVIMHVDIGEARRIERDLRQSSALLRAVIDGTPDLVFVKDLDSRFLLCNAAAALFAGRSVEQMVGHRVQDIYRPEDALLMLEGDRRVVRSGVAHTYEEVLRGAGASRTLLTTKAPYLDLRGEVAGVIGIVRDISELAHEQEALRELNAGLEERVVARTVELTRAREEAEHANRAKSAFLATMSHEIRTPMNGVIGMLDVLHRTSLKGYQVEMVDLIRDSAFSLLRIIEDVLDFSKIEAGKLVMEQEPMQVAGAVEKVCAMLDQMAVDRGVRISVFVDPAIPRVVSGDEIRLRQVLVNLASNAIKFSSGGDLPGRVSVRALLVDRHGESGTIDLVVTDNGIGMDSATQARLFTPFSQADVSTTRRFGGSGLGLAISEMLVRVMGGAISVQSSLGEGSVFTVHLPFHAASNEVAAAQAVPPEPGRLCRIVGSEEPLGGDLAAYLQHAGHRVELSPDLASAAEAEQLPGQWLWLILPGVDVPPLAELRDLPSGGVGVDTRFIVLGRGKRRRPRVEAVDFVSVDADLVLRGTLAKVLALAAGDDRESAADADAVETADGGAETSPGRRKVIQAGVILVAEDNETNRKVILLQLQLLGFTAEVAINGRDALERWRKGSYALLLTDLHMPEMDGYALTAAIRAEEPAGLRLPIIALTANVMRDEKTRCLAAGMDAYLTKPVRLPQLKAGIEAWLGSEAAAPAAGVDAPPADLGVLVALVGNDPDVIAEVLEAFRLSAGQASVELARAVATGSEQAVAEAAHKLKSAARSIGANRLGEVCAEMERAAETGQAALLHELLARFGSELNIVRAFLGLEGGDARPPP